jgi:Txe/YoeB family toxin of Txe-Axe toxin-antitoxin module
VRLLRFHVCQTLALSSDSNARQNIKHGRQKDNRSQKSVLEFVEFVQRTGYNIIQYNTPNASNPQNYYPNESLLPAHEEAVFERMYNHYIAIESNR